MDAFKETCKHKQAPNDINQNDVHNQAARQKYYAIPSTHIMQGGEHKQYGYAKTLREIQFVNLTSCHSCSLSKFPV